MPAGNRYDLRVPRGDDWLYELGFVTLDGTPVDMTGRQLAATVLPTLATGAYSLGVIGNDTGLVVLAATSPLTTVLPSRARWQLMQNVPGRVSTLLEGYLVMVDP